MTLCLCVIDRTRAIHHPCKVKLKATLCSVITSPCFLPPCSLFAFDFDKYILVCVLCLDVD